MEEESVLERRNTKQRQLVLEVVRRHGGHISADEVYLKAREIDSSISRGTIYRNLKLLGQSGEIKQVRLPGADQFDVRTDRHDHLICKRCGKLVDVALPYDERLDRQLAAQSGCRIDSHQTLFDGLCPECYVRQKQEQEE